MAVELGQSFNVFHRELLKKNIFASPPAIVEKKEGLNESLSVMKLYASHDDYVKEVLSAGVGGEINPVICSTKTMPGYNSTYDKLNDLFLKITSSMMRLFTHLYEVRKVHASLDPAAIKLEDLSEEFKSAVESLPGADTPIFGDLDRFEDDKDVPANEQLEAFINDFGLFYVAAGYHGGQRIITIKAKAQDFNQEKVDEILEKMQIYDQQDPSERSAPELPVETVSWHGQKDVAMDIVSVKFTSGGDDVITDQIQNVSADMVSAWEEAISSNPAPLLTDLKLAPIHEVVSLVDKDKGELLKKFAELALKPGIRVHEIYSYGSSMYTGQLKNGRQEGHGQSVVAADGTWIHGWWDTQVSGFTTMIQPDKYIGMKSCVYVGNFDSGFQSGDGVSLFSVGSVYVGNHEFGEPKGKGTWFYPDGTRKVKTEEDD